MTTPLVDFLTSNPDTEVVTIEHGYLTYGQSFYIRKESLIRFIE